MQNAREVWGTRIGLILAMAGNAVGLGNFLRFPTQAAENGGGAFMIAYFISLLLLGIPLMWIEWGLGRHGGRFGKGHIPGMFAAVWRHPAAKYLGVIGLVIPLVVFSYYAYIESWTLAYTVFSVTGDYWGLESQEAMSAYLQSFQGISDTPVHFSLTPYLFFAVTMAINVYVVSKGLALGIERLAKIGLPILFLFAAVLAVFVLLQPAGPQGDDPFDGLQFIYQPDVYRLSDASIWLAAAGQIFFTLSVGMGTLQTYASYLSRKDDIALSGIATVATNETAEVVLGSTIAIPAAATFFGVASLTAIAQSGAFNLGFVTMPVIFQQMPLGQVLGFFWFGLLFIAGITSSVAMATPILAFIREEFGVRRETAACALGLVVFLLGLLHITWLEYGFMDEWDYWGGTFGLVVFATIEVMVFVWIFKPENAWESIHEGADIRIPGMFKFVMTYITPLFLFVILSWWVVTDAFPILTMQIGAGGEPVVEETIPYIHGARALLVLAVVIGLILIRLAWQRNGHVLPVEILPADEALKEETKQ